MRKLATKKQTKPRRKKVQPYSMQNCNEKKSQKWMGEILKYRQK